MAQTLSKASLLAPHHLLQLLIGQSILLLQLVLLGGEGRLELVHLVHSLPDLLQAHVEMQLLFLQITALLVVQLHLRHTHTHRNRIKQEQRGRRFISGTDTTDLL